jgi:hypothetical protein
LPRRRPAVEAPSFSARVVNKESRKNKNRLKGFEK